MYRDDRVFVQSTPPSDDEKEEEEEYRGGNKDKHCVGTVSSYDDLPFPWVGEMRAAMHTGSIIEMMKTTTTTSSDSENDNSDSDKNDDDDDDVGARWIQWGEPWDHLEAVAAAGAVTTAHVSDCMHAMGDLAPSTWCMNIAPSVQKASRRRRHAALELMCHSAPWRHDGYRARRAESSWQRKQGYTQSVLERGLFSPSCRIQKVTQIPVDIYYTPPVDAICDPRAKPQDNVHVETNVATMTPRNAAGVQWMSLAVESIKKHASRTPVQRLIAFGRFSDGALVRIYQQSARLTVAQLVADWQRPIVQLHGLLRALVTEHVSMSSSVTTQSHTFSTLFVLFFIGHTRHMPRTCAMEPAVWRTAMPRRCIFIDDMCNNFITNFNHIDFSDTSDGGDVMRQRMKVRNQFIAMYEDFVDGLIHVVRSLYDHSIQQSCGAVRYLLRNTYMHSNSMYERLLSLFYYFNASTPIMNVVRSYATLQFFRLENEHWSVGANRSLDDIGVRFDVYRLLSSSRLRQCDAVPLSPPPPRKGRHWRRKAMRREEVPTPAATAVGRYHVLDDEVLVVDCNVQCAELCDTESDASPHPCKIVHDNTRDKDDLMRDAYDNVMRVVRAFDNMTVATALTAAIGGGDAPQHDDWDSIALQALVKRATEHMETHGTVSLDNWLYWIKDIDATLRHVPSPTEEMLLYLRKQLLV